MPEIDSLADRAFDLTFCHDDALRGFQGPLQFLSGNHHHTVIVADQPVAGTNHLPPALHGNADLAEILRSSSGGHPGPREAGKGAAPYVCSAPTVLADP